MFCADFKETKITNNNNVSTLTYKQNLAKREYTRFKVAYGKTN